MHLKYEFMHIVIWKVNTDNFIYPHMIKKNTYCVRRMTKLAGYRRGKIVNNKKKNIYK